MLFSARAVSLSVGAALYASATVYTNVLDATRYLAPRTAANWNDPAFWGGGGVPNGSDAFSGGTPRTIPRLFRNRKVKFRIAGLHSGTE